MPVRLSAALLVVIAALLRPALVGAQQRPGKQLYLSVFTGVATGARLWNVDRQPLAILGRQGVLLHDTLRVSRVMRAGPLLGVAGVYFPSPHVGLTAEMTFYGLGIRDACTFAYQSPFGGVSAENEQVCSDIDGHTASTTTIGFYVGGVYRPQPLRQASPYVRLLAGITTRAASQVLMVGRFVDSTTGYGYSRLVIGESARGHTAPTVGGALGVGIRLSPGYQLRLEGRDLLLAVDRVTSPADDLGNALVSSAFVQNFSLVVGVDVVLEQLTRGRH